jgi:cytochrome c oxidase assembly protein subunit 15
MIDNQAALRFRRLGIVAIIAIYVVILVGGLVRASGAGMGCPDWPTCFGQWIPPTAELQLPTNYHEIYAERGYKNTHFNPIKTWIEYMNRLVGVSIGMIIILTTWASRIYLTADKGVFHLMLLILLLVCLQGGLGSAVVTSHLQPFMITLHMLVALLIVILLIYAITRSQHHFIIQLTLESIPLRAKTLLMIAMMMTLSQVIMGVQIREAVDIMANATPAIERHYWREGLPLIFYLHRSFSAFILVINLWLSGIIYRHSAKKSLLVRAVYGLMLFIIIAILAGISLDRLGMPAVAQPLHLLMANLIFGIQFFIYMCLHYAQQPLITANSAKT